MAGSGAGSWGRGRLGGGVGQGLPLSPKLCPSAGPAGCLARNPLLPLLLFISLGFFMLQLTTLLTAEHSGWSQVTSLSQPHSSFPAGLCRPCPWNWGLFQGSCYLFSWTQSDWKSAVSACQDIGAQLVIIKSPEEQVGWIWYVRYNKPTWIGLSDHHNEGSWKWVDNSPLQLSFWKKGEPNNHEDEDCVELYNDGWNDGKCSTQNSWICEKPSAPCPAL
uniref:C-type lectin domain-containing protein n=1 Tax=Balaenoptera musculus TaxID=9771 RepID=A0A8C0HSZ2_BALMU